MPSWSLVLFVIHHKEPSLAVQYMQDFQTNFVIALTVIFTLGVGSILPVFILYKSSYTLSRRKFKDS